MFLDDAKQPGRLFLAKEQPSRFTLDDLDVRTFFSMNIGTGPYKRRKHVKL